MAKSTSCCHFVYIYIYIYICTYFLLQYYIFGRWWNGSKPKITEYMILFNTANRWHRYTFIFDELKVIDRNQFLIHSSHNARICVWPCVPSFGHGIVCWWETAPLMSGTHKNTWNYIHKIQFYRYILHIRLVGTHIPCKTNHCSEVNRAVKLHNLGIGNINWTFVDKMKTVCLDK